MDKILAILIFIAVLVGGGYYLLNKGSLSLPVSKVDPQVVEIQKRGKLVVGTDATYPPLEYVNEKGEIIGFDVDIAGEIAKDMDVVLELKNIPFDKIFDALKNGEVDVVISSVTITTERQKSMLFSSPYLNAGQVIVVAEATSDITDPISLKDKKVGVQNDTTSESESMKYTDFTRIYVDYSQAKTDLLVGKIDAIIIDYPAGVSMVQSNGGGLKVVGKPFTSEFYGVAVNLEKTGLLSQINDTIARIKKEGRLTEIENLWFKK